MSIKLDITHLHASFRPFRDYLITMVPIVVLSTYVYGWRVPVMLGISTVTAVIGDLLVFLMRKGTMDISDISSITFAWILTLLLPASVSYSILITGTLITVLIGKHAFGGYGAYPFNPVAFGFAFTAVAYPNDVFSYPAPFSSVPLSWVPDVELFKSPAFAMSQGARPGVGITEMILGEYNGPAGTTFCIVAISCLVLLIVHDAMTWHIPVAYMTTFAALAFAFPRFQGTRPESMLSELICGLVPFSAAYLVSEPTSSPKNSLAKLVYGVVLGAVSMAFTWFGTYEVAICFALLASSPIGSFLDRKLSGSLIPRKEGAANGQN